MKGKVKWFSKEKGYGFVTDEAATDRHFSVRDVIGSELPPTGAIIEFEPKEGKKGPRAQAIRIISKPPLATSYAFKQRDDRATCGKCGKQMVPRIITYRGSLERSVCPFCGSTHKYFGIPWGWIFLGGFLLAGIFGAIR